jgi:hypothetical protein
MLAYQLGRQRKAVDVMKRSDIDELLVALYLRLNGYFTTGLIVHSHIQGQAKAEFDCLAVRLPNHSQEDRQIESDAFLDMKPGTTDFIFCEVKHEPNMVSFNKSAREDPSVLAAMLRWTGLFEREKVANVAERLHQLVNSYDNAETAKNGVREGNIRVRAILCCPKMATKPGGWYLTGDVILPYLQACFNPQLARATCSTRYNFEQWTYPLNSIVRFVKDKTRVGTVPDLEALYSELATQ